jgi:site-specific DNA recombinase
MPEEGNSSENPVLIYCRVSTKRLSEGTSLESQRDACIALTHSLGYRVARVTQEVHSGADLFGRPLLMRDRADIRAGKFRALIAYSVDRLTRSDAHLALISAGCEHAGCRLVFVSGDSGDFPSRRDEAYAAGVERESISERMRRGRAAKLRGGRPSFAGFCLYGYRPDRERGVYVIFEPEAAVVRRVFSLCASGRGMHGIASLLNREGVPAPKAAYRPGARWSSGAVSNLLNCGSYKGEEYCGRTRRVGDTDQPLPRSEWIKLPDGVRPPIVSNDLFDECRRAVRARAERMNNKGSRPSLLRGHLFCSECGAGMIRNHFKRGKYEYEKYRCASRWRPFKTECRGEGVTLALIDEWVWAAVKEIVSNQGALSRALDSVKPDEQLGDDLETAKREHGRAGKALDSLLSLARRDPSLLPHAGREAARAARERGEMEKVIAELEGRVGEGLKRAADLRRLVDLRERYRDSLDHFTLDERRLALRALGFRAHANGDDPARWRCEAAA